MPRKCPRCGRSAEHDGTLARQLADNQFDGYCLPCWSILDLEGTPTPPPATYS